MVVSESQTPAQPVEVIPLDSAIVPSAADERRIVIVPVAPARMMSAFVRPDDEVETIVQLRIAGIPEGYRVHHVDYNYSRACFDVVVSHPDFAPVPDLRTIPRLDDAGRMVALDVTRPRWGLGEGSRPEDKPRWILDSPRSGAEIPFGPGKRDMVVAELMDTFSDMETDGRDGVFAGRLDFTVYAPKVSEETLAPETGSAG